MTVNHIGFKTDMEDNLLIKDNINFLDKGVSDNASPQGNDVNDNPTSILDLLGGAVERIIQDEKPFKCSDQTCCPRKNVDRLIQHRIMSQKKAMNDFWNSDERKQLSKHQEEVSKKILKARGTYSSVSPYVKKHKQIADLLGILPNKAETSAENGVTNGCKRSFKRRKIYRDISDWGLSDEEEFYKEGETTHGSSESPNTINSSVEEKKFSNHLTEGIEKDINTLNDIYPESCCSHSQQKDQKENIINREVLCRKSNKENVLCHDKNNSQLNGSSENDDLDQHAMSNYLRRRPNYDSEQQTFDNVQESSINLRHEISITLRQKGDFCNKQTETSSNLGQGTKGNLKSTPKDVLNTGLYHNQQRPTLYNFQLERLNDSQSCTLNESLISENPNGLNLNAPNNESLQSHDSNSAENKKCELKTYDPSNQYTKCGFPSSEQGFESLRDSRTYQMTEREAHIGTEGNMRHLQSSCSDFDAKRMQCEKDQLDEDDILFILDTLLRAQCHFKNVVPSLNPEEFSHKIEKYMKEKQMSMDQSEPVCIEQDAIKVLLLEHLVKFFGSKIIEIVKFAKCIPGFRDLNTEDQAKLIKVSRLESAMVSNLPGVNVKTGLVKTDNDGALPLELLGSVISPTFLHDFVKIGRKIENTQVTEKEAAILRGITLTFSDRCQLREPEKVERIQKKLVTCLQYVIERETTTMLLSVRMGQLFDILTSLRNFTDVDSNVLQGCIKTYSNNDNDLVNEFLERDTS